MSKTIRIVVAILIVNLVISLFLFSLDLSENSENLYKAISRYGMVLLTILAIRKTKVWPYLKNSLLWTVVAVALVILGFYRMQEVLAPYELANQTYTNVVYLVRCLGTGFFEELLFRVLLFSGLFYGVFKHKPIKKRYFWSMVWASIGFGLAHLTNLINPENEVIGIVSQVIFAFFIGLLFQGLLIRFRSVILVGALHGLVNYFGAYKSRLGIPVQYEETALTDALISLGTLTLVCAIISIPLTILLTRKAIEKGATA